MFVEVHVKVALDPLATVAGDAVSVALGADTELEPPPPHDADETTLRVSAPRASHPQ